MQETEISSVYDHDALSFGGYQKKKKRCAKNMGTSYTMENESNIYLGGDIEALKMCVWGGRYGVFGGGGEGIG